MSERVVLDDFNSIPAPHEDELDPRLLESLLGASEDARARTGGGEAAVVSAEPFAGLSHAEVLGLAFGDEPPDLIEGLVPRGVVVTTAGLPETYKGWVCTKKAEMIAAGAGELFGCKVRVQGPVGYFWQDDSTRHEAERVQLYARVHETPDALAVRWFLNEDLQLPRDLARLRATIEHHCFVYVVLDSFYNMAGGIDLKDRGAGVVFAAIKSEICDPTGCTVDVVDHMPWATDTNRKRSRAYGDMFKNAVVRAGLYIDADGSKLSVEARGNNIPGFKRTPAYWDPEALELRLADAVEVSDEAYEQRILDYLAEHPWATTDELVEEVEGRAQKLRAARQRVSQVGIVTSAPSPDVGLPGKGLRWNLASAETFRPVPQFGTPSDPPNPQSVTFPEPRPPRPTPVGGTAFGTDTLSDDDERPADQLWEHRA